MVKISTSNGVKYPQKVQNFRNPYHTAAADAGTCKAYPENAFVPHTGHSGRDHSRTYGGEYGEHGKPGYLKCPIDSSDGVRYCRLTTDAYDMTGCPVRCYSVLAFSLEAHVVLDYTFIYDVTRSRVRFERLIRVARRERLSPDQLRYLVEDMTAAGLL